MPPAHDRRFGRRSATRRSLESHGGSRISSFSRSLLTMLNDTLVLCYHAVSPGWPIGLAVTPAELDRQVLWLLEHGYTAATFHQAVTQPPSTKTFAVTFDDGWISVLRHGFPVLSALGVPATVFISTSFVDSADKPLVGPELIEWQGGPHHDELYPLSWPNLLELSNEGWEVGSHTMTHAWLTRVDDVRLKRELSGSKERCEEMLGRPCRTIAYPKGDFDVRVEQATGEAGYEAGAILPRRFSKPRPLAWPRVSIQRGDSDFVFRAKISRTLRVVRRSPVWPVVDGTRRIVSQRRAATRRG
jgi:peptidoglycan/xylan/chitin deacetylase (PgdA/CDA1 family)